MERMRLVLFVGLACSQIRAPWSIRSFAFKTADLKLQSFAGTVRRQPAHHFLSLAFMDPPFDSGKLCPRVLRPPDLEPLLGLCVGKKKIYDLAAK